MSLPYDPASPNFKDAIRTIPGYPAGADVPIQAMVFESDAYKKIPAVLEQIGARPDQPLFIVTDEFAIKRAGVELKPFLAEFLEQHGWQPEIIYLAPRAGESLHTDMHQIERVQSRLANGVSLLAVGSGTVTDVAKHAAFLFEQGGGEHVPFVVMPTANSVSAYTSNTASVQVGGVKKTLHSRYLDALICDIETLSSAPRSATVAGVGDLVVCFQSFADWYLAARMGHDKNYSDLPRTLIGPLDQTFLQNAADVRDATPKGTELLAKLLALEGIAQSLAHTSAPFSGFEHSISHLLDMMVSRSGQKPILHGTQVALLTILTTLAFQRFMDEFDPATLDLAACFPDRAAMESRVKSAFATLNPSGTIGNECWIEYSKKLYLWNSQPAVLENFVENWSKIRAELDAIVRPPALLIEILQGMDSPTSFEQLDPPMPESQIRFAFENGSLIRSRFTLGDLFIFLNWDMDQLWHQIWDDARALVTVPS